jgi:hypothetical protein
MKKFLILLFFLLTASNVHALSIVYDGFKCTDTSMSSDIPAQSIFTIEEDLGNGTYKLLLEGGYLDFRDKICLELLDTSVDPSNIYGLSKINAIAYFNGNTLVISYGIIKQNKDIISGTPILLADINFPSTYTLVFDYLSFAQAFKLKSVTKLDNLFSALNTGGDTKRSFSLTNVFPVLPVEDIKFLIKE